MLSVVFESFVVIVDGYGKDAFGGFLPDDILVKESFNVGRDGDIGILDFVF